MSLRIIYSCGQGMWDTRLSRKKLRLFTYINMYYHKRMNKNYTPFSSDSDKKVRNSEKNFS
jgi:hypothetical protein